jgi:hypothetical protein
MFRSTAASLVVLALSAVPAHAAEGDAGVRVAAPKVIITQPVVETPEKRPAVLPFLYVSLAGLQAYDVYSTRQGLLHGAREMNPLMSPVAGDMAGMIVAKAVSSVTTIVMAERLWHRNKAAAILTMVAANSAMAIVAMNNARVLHQTR